MPDDRWNITWLSCGLAFVGGYGDAASFILANTFTGHLTGNFVLSAISLASRDWPTLLRRGLAIACFLIGILLSVVLEAWLAKKPARSFLPAVLGLEIVLMAMAYVALSAHLAVNLRLFVICMALALGLQNGAWRQAGGLTVHSTYVTGMVTNLLTTGARRFMSRTPQESGREAKVSLLWGIWLAFLCGAVLGALAVLRFSGLGIIVAAVVLLAMLLYLFSTTGRP